MTKGEQWRNELVEILENSGGKAYLSEIYESVRNRGVMDISFPSWQASVRYNLEIRSSDSDAFKGDEDLFYAVDGKGEGHWGLRATNPSSSFGKTNDTLSEIQQELNERESELIDDGLFSPVGIKDAREIGLRAIVLRRGQSSFREKILIAYNHQCAVSGSTCTPTLEAAHIIPYLGEETNHVQNGLLLRSDIHTLFDLGLLWITADYQIMIHPSVADPSYLRYHGTSLMLPEDAKLHPSVEALKNRSEQAAVSDRDKP